MFRFFSFLGDRARYPLELRPEGLVTAPIVVAVLRTGENAFDQHECVFPVYKPCHTALGAVDGFES